MHPLLNRVEKPGRYTGGELNQIVKENARVRVALCFPDVYEVAMSHTGLRILYHCINEVDGYAAERCYAPWPDMEAALRETKTPLWTLETQRPLSDLDMVGFSLQYELAYPTVLNMLDLGGIPVRSADRTDAHPLVIAGGSGAFNPEPLANFVDAFLIGEGEDAIVELCALLELKLPRKELLSRVARVKGMYVPSLVEFEFEHGGPIKAIRGPVTEHRQVRDLNAAPFPLKPLVANVPIVHDRVGIEVQRGCTKGCRFCQAGMIFRPTRQRDPAKVLRIVEESLNATGQDEVSFLSLSIGDYEPLQPLLQKFFDTYDADKVGVSLPSLRTETLTQDVVNEIARGKKHSFTLAPEAGSDRMRRVINKGNTEANLMQAVDTAVKAGWKSLKYYFMIGLPYENQDDRDAIAHLGIRSKHGRRLDVTVSVSSFVPKPHTPFQWEPQISEEEIRKQQDHLRALLKKGKCDFRYHNAGQTWIEGVISRGDRRVGDVIEKAWKLGCRLDAWDEHFSFEKWAQALTALEQHGLSWEWYHRRRGLDEILPWDAIDSGVDKKFLKKELAKAHREAEVEDCAWGKCAACSACDFKTMEPIVYPRAALHVGERAPRVEPPAQRTLLRVQFEKSGIALYSSHLETSGALLRAFRRGKLEVAHTLGMRPKPKVSFSPALPFGYASKAELFDIELYGTTTPDEVLATLRRVAPNGVTFVSAWPIAQRDEAVANALSHMTYVASGIDAERVLAQWHDDEPLRAERVKQGKGRRYDLRAELSAVERVSDEAVSFVIVQRIDGTIQPKEIAAALGFDAQWTKTSVTFGAPTPSPAELFKAPVVFIPRERERDELANAPFKE